VVILDAIQKYCIALKSSLIMLVGEGFFSINTPLQLILQNIWPTHCTPEMRTIEQSDDDITLVLTSPTATYLPERQQFNTHIRAPENHPIQPTHTNTIQIRMMMTERDGNQSLHNFAMIRVDNPPDIEPKNDM
jgi:Isocitrate dehydrogenases